MKKLIKIQSELKAPKNQLNDFGKYNYRSAEDILEALKPLLLKYECLLIVTDEIIEKNGNTFVKSTAKFQDGDFVTSADGYARHADQKKKMDDSQITGSASSYARKYALNGLFLIDDTKDADAQQPPQDTPGKPELTMDSKQFGQAVEAIQSKKATFEKVISYLKNNFTVPVEIEQELLKL